MKKIFGLAVLALLLFVGVGSVQAGTLKGASLTLESPLVDRANTRHTFRFTVSTPGTIMSVKFQYCKVASGTCELPTGLQTTAATLDGTHTIPQGTWAIAGAPVNGSPYITSADGGSAVNATTVLSVPLNAITNSSMDGCQAGGLSDTDTCYVNISTYLSTDTTGNATDTTTVSYTTVAAVVVQVRVDPTFTFVVSSVPAGQANNGITTSVGSTFNGINFGNLTANTPKYAAQKLNVTTNTQGGYTVDVLMTDQLTGVYTSNNIDPFINTWASPAVWTAPSGSTPNINTGYFGGNTTDTDVTGWSSGTNKFGGIIANTSHQVMRGTGSDNGTGSVYVTYAIEANVFQPADAYTGTIVYNALPTY